MCDPFKLTYTIVIFIHYKPWIVVVDEDLEWVANKKNIVIIKTVPWIVLF